MGNENYVTIRPLNREDSVLYFPPEAFGPFRVLHQIGAGTLGPVFRAYEAGRDRLVAVKVFRLDLTPEQASALVAELEALIATGLTHPNIAAPIAAGLEHGVAYLAQEYAVGSSLDIVLRESGPLSMAEVASLVDAVAAALDHAAGRHVHHGSLHLRDIVISRGAPPPAPAVPRLIDGVSITGFGVAQALAKIGARRPTRPQYTAPDAPSDVYSLGVIAFEAATGRRASPDNLNEFEEAYGGALRAAFGHALAADPEDRPKRAGAFAALLRGTGIAADAAPANLEELWRGEAQASATADVRDNAAAADLAAIPDDAAAHDIEPAGDDPMDRVIELGAPRGLDIGEPADIADDTPEPAAPFPASWSAQPPRPLQASEVADEPPARRWPIVAVFMAFAVLTALSVGFFLRSTRTDTGTQQESGVDETTVDLPADASPPGAPASGAPNAPNAPVAPIAPVAPNTSVKPSPPPSPSRPASGAVRTAQRGSMLIRSSPADADVTVNGEPRGRTPLALRDLALGSYTIRVARDGYAPEVRTLQLTSRRPTASATIDLRAAAAAAAPAGPGGLTVQSRPAGAQVFVNDRLVGSTPLTIAEVPAGTARVRIELDGYQPWITTVRVSPGDPTRVAASLERRQTP